MFSIITKLLAQFLRLAYSSLFHVEISYSFTSKSLVLHKESTKIERMNERLNEKV